MEPEKTLLALIDLTTAFLTSTAQLIRKRQRPNHEVKPKKKHTKSGYQLFTDHCLQQLKGSTDTRDQHTATNLIDVTKQVAVKWKQLTPEERARWKNQADSAKPIDPDLLNLLEEEPSIERKKRGNAHSARSPTPTETESEED